MKQIRLGELKDVLDVLEEVFSELNIDFYMIGAIAKEYWYTQGNKRVRQTKDVDFAVLVSSNDTYKRVRDRLKDHQFADTRENAFVMISPQGIQVDLLPFGEIAIDDGVRLSGEGMTSIRVNGFIEIYQTGTVDAVIQTGHMFKAATLPAIVLLKLVAYDDRPEQRQKDARDIAGIIQHFFDLQAEFVYENYAYLFVDDRPDKQIEDYSAIVIGSEMKKMCGDNEALKERLIKILTEHITQGPSSPFIRQMVGETEEPVDKIIKWLKETRSGLYGH